MKKMILTVAAVAAVAVSAKAQNLYAQAGDPVAISSLTDANAQGGVTYEWYRNGVRIPGCNEASCIIPADLATGTNVKFQRRAIALGCAIGNSSNTNAVTITFCNVVQGGVCWGDVNVSSWRTNASQADANAVFFQFNRTKEWPATGSVSGWTSTAINDVVWGVDSLPCPSGWRLPTNTECSELSNNSIPIGGTWAAANSNRGNSIAGRFYGKNSATCSLNNMQGCVFFPALGMRSSSTGALTDTDRGFYWSATQYSNTNTATAYILRFFNTESSVLGYGKANGFTVRCVRGNEQ